ncbi:MAG: hypothetical protein O9327_18135 [Polaromonas sp.]|nr:hypothetical protein [Polaromonas sp.]
MQMRQQQVLELQQVLGQQRVLVLVQVQELLPSCRKQPEQQRQR